LVHGLVALKLKAQALSCSSWSGASGNILVITMWDTLSALFFPPNNAQTVDLNFALSLTLVSSVVNKVVSPGANR
jgi:hypothetical protein